MNEYKIIDFHTHVFDADEFNICTHVEHCNMTVENTKRDLTKLGVEKVCGSVINKNRNYNPDFAFIKSLNDKALELRDYYDGFYIPGFHVHPNFVKESIKEASFMDAPAFSNPPVSIPYFPRKAADSSLITCMNGSGIPSFV